MCQASARWRIGMRKQDHLRDRDWNQAAEEIRCKERYHERFRNMQRLDHSGCLVFVDVFVFETINHGNWLLALWKWMDFWTSKIQDMEVKIIKKNPLKYRFVSPGGRLLKRAGLADVYLQGLLGKTWCSFGCRWAWPEQSIWLNTPYFQVRKTHVFLNIIYFTELYFLCFDILWSFFCHGDHPFGEASFFALIFDRLHHVGKAWGGGKWWRNWQLLAGISENWVCV